MQVKTILNRLQKHRGFVYGTVQLEEQIAGLALTVEIEADGTAATDIEHQKSDRDAGEWGPPENRGWFASRIVASNRSTACRSIQPSVTPSLTCWPAMRVGK